MKIILKKFNKPIGNRSDDSVKTSMRSKHRCGLQFLVFSRWLFHKKLFFFAPTNETFNNSEPSKAKSVIGRTSRGFSAVEQLYKILKRYLAFLAKIFSRFLSF